MATVRYGGERQVRRFVFLLILITAALVAVACARVLLQRSMDYDEIAHAHAVWLTSLGDVPFYDFFEVHPPFSWLALAPLAHGETDAEALVRRLRVSSLAGQIVFFVLLAANMRRERQNLDWVWIAVALLTMLTSEGNVDYLIECRPDVWAAVALLGGILLARGERLRPFVRYAGFGFLAAASLLWSPKLIALAGLFGLVETIRSRRVIVTAASMIAGGAAAFGVALIVLYAARIDPSDAWAITVSYHAALGRHGGWGAGLWRTITDQWPLSGAAAGGLACWLVAVARRELRPNSFEISVAGFLIAQLLLVPFPYKQYFAPWLFFAAVFIPFYSLVVDRVRLLRAIALPVAMVILCATAAVTLQLAGATDGFSRTGDYWSFVKSQSGADRRIVAPIASHPITARDAMYAVIGTTGVDIRYGPEAILEELAHPRFSPRLTFAHYLRELETHRPNVIVPGRWPDSLFPIQQRAVDQYLADHAALYERRVIGWRVVFVRRTTPD